MSYPPPRPPMMPHMPGMPPAPFPYGMMPPPMPGMMGPRPTIPLPALAVEKPPITTVFVGNISDRAPDMMVRQMLQRCGHVVSWKRVQGVSGKLQTFGFCEFDNPEATLRCIRLLNGYEILDKKLSVKVDQKTREQLSEYLKKINMNKNPKKVVAGGRNHVPNESSATGDMFNLEQTDENTLKDDRMVLNGFEMLMKQYASQMNEPDQPIISSEFVPNTNISSIPQSEMTSAELKLASMEAAAALIKEEEKKKEAPTVATEQSPVAVSEETVAKKPKLEEKVIREKERQPAPSSRERVRTPPPKSRRSPSPSSSPSITSRYDRGRGQHEVTRTRSRSPARMKRRVSPDQESGLTEEESEEMRERKRLERRLREKELAYRERLKAWETREDKKRHDYSAERKREKQRKKQMLKDAKKLKQFLEDYDDAKDDPSHYKGSSWERLLKQRQKELEADNKDKQRERDELDDLKRKLIEKGLSDVDDEIKRLQLEEIQKFEKLDRSSSSESEEEEPVIPDRLLENKENEQTISNKPPAQFEPIKSIEEDINSPMSESIPETTTTNNIKNESDMEDSSSNRINNMVAESSADDESCQDSPLATQSQDTLADQIKNDEEKTSEIEESPSSKSPIFSGVETASAATAPQTQQITSHFIARSVTIKKSTVKPSKSIQPVNQLFAEDEEEQASIQMRKNRIDSEERKRAVKKLVESIPTDRDELFAYPIDWDQLDQSLMEKRIKPWINKKIIEYIGEEEPSLNDFICSKIQQRPEADKLLEEIKVVLEEEAELFVKKMWRLIVYETESKRCGLSK